MYIKNRNYELFKYFIKYTSDIPWEQLQYFIISILLRAHLMYMKISHSDSLQVFYFV